MKYLSAFELCPTLGHAPTVARQKMQIVKSEFENPPFLNVVTQKTDTLKMTLMDQYYKCWEQIIFGSSSPPKVARFSDVHENGAAR